MPGWVKIQTVRSIANRKRRYILIFAVILAVTLLVVACGPSTESSPSATATPRSRQTEPKTDLPPAEVPLSQYLRFGHLTTEDGLSNNAIWGIAQDRNGFMWIGTYSGLNRYDGSGFKVYRHMADDPYSLSADSIRGLITDQNGVLWAGTWDAGLNEYDQATDRFTRYQHDPDDLRSLSHNGIRTIYEDRTGSIWVGTLGGLNKLDPATKQFNPTCMTLMIRIVYRMILSGRCMKTPPGFSGLARMAVSIGSTRKQKLSSTIGTIPTIPKVLAITRCGPSLEMRQALSGWAQWEG